MAELIRSVEDEVPISYGRFDLLDGSDYGQEAEPETEAGALLAEPDQIALGQVGIRSQAWAQRAHVRMEAWDAEPPAPGGSWAEAGQVHYLSPGGTVQLRGLMHSPSGQMLLLGPPFFAYGLRAYAGPVHTQPADYDARVTEAVEEMWLLRFWPLADAAGPVLRAETETTGWDPRRMRHILPLESGQRLEETLGDLRIDMLGNLPRNVDSWSQSMLEEYATQLRVSMRIGRELNPHGAPTLQLAASSVRTVLIGPDPGISGRAWVWASDETAHADVLSVDRQVIARDRIRRNTLLTGIVTILRKENDFVEVRAATQAEAARVLSVEQLRS